MNAGVVLYVKFLTAITDHDGNERGLSTETFKKSSPWARIVVKLKVNITLTSTGGHRSKLSQSVKCRSQRSRRPAKSDGRQATDPDFLIDSLSIPQDSAKAVHDKDGSVVRG
jgi:hypothetical protein